VRQFLPVQRRLAEGDLLNIWTVPVGSAVYAVLPGCAEGDWLGRALLA
jgi:dye decolorizing peroxidase